MAPPKKPTTAAGRHSATLTPAFAPSREVAADPAAAIVDAAARCFARWGIPRTRVEDIAAEVGIARPHIYRHFASKDAIVHAVVLREIRHHHRRLAKKFPHRGCAADLIVGSLLSGIYDAARDPDMQFLVGDDAAHLTARALTSSPEIVEELRAHWIPLLEYAKERGELRAEVDIARAAQWLVFVQFSYLALPELVPVALHLKVQLREFVLPALVK